MSTKRTLWSLLGVILLAAAGCAPAYHAYPCGCVPYGYCPEPPLPFTDYCGRPTPRAEKSDRQHPTAPAENVGGVPRPSEITPSVE